MHLLHLNVWVYTEVEAERVDREWFKCQVVKIFDRLTQQYTVVSKFLEKCTFLNQQTCAYSSAPPSDAPMKCIRPNPWLMLVK
jgi:hypothetical protein